MLFRLCSFITVAVVVSACQTAQTFNGQTGYKIEQHNEKGLILDYTLASQSTEKMIQSRLDQACKQSLNQANVRWTLLSRHTVAADATVTTSQTIALNHAQNRFGFSNTPRLHNAADYASEQVIDTKPATLDVLRVQCETIS